MLRQENYYQVHLIQSHKVEEVVEEFCQICCLKYEKTKKQAFRPALTCYQCWYMHVKTHVQKISYNVGSSIISPFQSQDQIDVCIALNGLNKQHKEELQQFLFKKYTTFTKDIGKCPSQSCDFVYMASKCKWNANHECPKCLTPLAMTQNFTLKSVLGFIYFIFLANKCPKCQIPIERISGCPHMTCPCGHEFCWFCLKDHSENLNNLNTVHEPKQCASIFFSKIIILMTCLLSLSCFLVGGETLRWLMDGMFNILGYLIHCLIVDLFFSAQWVVVDMYRNQPYKRLPFQGSSKIVKIQILVLINVIFIGVLCLLDLFYVTVGILLVELGLVGFGSGVVYAVFYSCETWFQFIN